MTSYSWTTDVSADWNTAIDWNTGTVPSDSAADVTIDALTTIAQGYTVAIAAGESEIVNSLTMNGTNDLTGSASSSYTAATLQLYGTLDFATGSPGLLGGSSQTHLYAAGDAAEIINAGTINGYIQSEGTLLITGTNGVYVTNYLQSASGTVTIDTIKIAEISGTGAALFDGKFEADAGAVINLGGPLEKLVVSLGTIEGPSGGAGGWTSLSFDGAGSEINEWNGTTIVPVESTLTNINAGGIVDVLGGRDYTTAHTLTVEGATGNLYAGILNLQAGIVTTGGIDIAGGVIQGSGTIVGRVQNAGTLMALNGTLDLTGSLTGTGTVGFDYDTTAAATTATGATLEVNGVSATETIVMNGDDTLILNTPSAFAGTIAATVGDQIVLRGVTATSAVLSGSTLVVSNGTTVVASLALSGGYTGDSFSVSGSTIKLVPYVSPSPGEVIMRGSHNQYVVASNGSLYIQDAVSGRDGTQTLPGVTKMVFTDGTGVFDPTGTAEEVARLYGVALDRAPDLAGLQGWTADIDDSHVPLSVVANAFTTSPEFIQGHGSLSNAAFVNQLYENALGRTADAAGSANWQALLASGASRGTVVLGFAESQEYEAKTLSTAGDNDNGEVYRLYGAALDRTPDPAGQADWSSALAAGETVTQVAQGFVNSAEFQQDDGKLSISDFVTALYKNVLNRAPDAAGLQAWTSALQGGASEASVVVGFSDSLEYRASTASETHANWVFIPN